MSQLPYLASPGNVTKVLNAIRAAATPPKVSQDFVKTVLGIPGSSGDQMTTFLKRIGFASNDGSPTELYRSYRTADGGKAVAQAIRQAYQPLYALNEYLHDCNEAEIRDYIIRETGLARDARPVGLIYSTLRGLLDVADFSEAPRPIGTEEEPSNVKDRLLELAGSNERAPKYDLSHHKLNIGYTINLNLPETSDIQVFNAIFKSLKEHLLSDENG